MKNEMTQITTIMEINFIENCIRNELRKNLSILEFPNERTVQAEIFYVLKNKLLSKIKILLENQIELENQYFNPDLILIENMKIQYYIEIKFRSNLAEMVADISKINRIKELIKENNKSVKSDISFNAGSDFIDIHRLFLAPTCKFIFINYSSKEEVIIDSKL